MPNIKEIADRGAPTIKELRESQQRGSEGIGTSEYSYAEKMAIRNHGTGLGEGSDEKFSTPIKADGEGPKLPWE